MASQIHSLIRPTSSDAITIGASYIAEVNESHTGTRSTLHGVTRYSKYWDSITSPGWHRLRFVSQLVAREPTSSHRIVSDFGELFPRNTNWDQGK